MPTEDRGNVAGLEDTLSLAADSRPKEPVPANQQRIGPYRLLQLIGEGGMGEVWVAEQLEPVRRRVALKVIKAGMDTKQVVARFEAERQALALMDHRAIAKVLDGGATPEGRPYFVMEYVAGVPITEHCDRHRLSTEDRLRLLMEVCEGVQHAHQKAIIHRDLKPSNILVSLVDGHAQPKIIDFGIAKATAQRLTEKTLFTEVGSVIGTPEYMSPEQADLTGQDIDTRTDVYSLGVILYQLLTGELPPRFERAALLQLRGTAAKAAGGRAAPAEHAAQHGQRGSCPGGKEPEHRPGRTPAGAGGRPRRHHPQGAGEGPGATVRHPF